MSNSSRIVFPGVICPYLEHEISVRREIAHRALHQFRQRIGIGAGFESAMKPAHAPREDKIPSLSVAQEIKCVAIGEDAMRKATARLFNCDRGCVDAMRVSEEPSKRFRLDALTTTQFKRSTLFQAERLDDAKIEEECFLVQIVGPSTPLVEGIVRFQTPVWWTFRVPS